MELHRPKRLTRPETPPPFRLTERDITILRAIARWRFMSSDQIYRYLLISDPETSTQVVRRLHRLFAHGYLDRPIHQHVQIGALSHLVYGIGRSGARFLAELGEAIDPRLQWTAKNSRASSLHLLHTLEIAETMIRYEAACAISPGVRLIDHADLLPFFPLGSRTMQDPYRLRVTVTDNFKPVSVTVVPDRLFSLALGADRRFNFCLELDRATMSVAARNLSGKSSFARKIRAYLAAYRDGRHREQWGFQGFRVLTVTPSEKRIKNMIAAQRAITDDRLSAMFLYTTPEKLAAHGPLGNVWISSERNDIAVLEGREG